MTKTLGVLNILQLFTLRPYSHYIVYTKKKYKTTFYLCIAQIITQKEMLHCILYIVEKYKIIKKKVSVFDFFSYCLDFNMIYFINVFVYGK